MRVSVIIPSHNRRHCLGRALDSVFAQTLIPLEVILVDDGSDDDTARLVAERYPQCRYLRQPNRGVSSARNLGIRAARGAWLAFLDSDDRWLPHKLEVQAEELAANPDHDLCHTDEIWIRNGRRVNPMRKHHKGGGRIFRRCLAGCVISPSSVLIRRRLLERVGLFDESLPACEDYDLWLRICARHPVSFVDRPQIVKYGGHADQLSHRHWGMDRFRVQALEKILSTPALSPGDRAAALETVVEKAGILAQGAAKRGHRERSALYQAKQAKYACQLRDLRPAPA